MTSANNNLNNKKIQELLAAVGSGPTEDTSQVKAEEYSWQQPHCFTNKQLRKIDDFSRKAASEIAKKFTAYCHGDFNVTIVSATQHFADKLINPPSDEEQNDYYVTFGSDKGSPYGAIHIPSKTAFAWVTQLLGDAEAEQDPDRDLSELENSLLLDITSVIIGAFSGSYDGYDFKPAKNIARGVFPLKLQGAEEFYKITFRIEKIDSENSTEAHFLIPCHKLEPVAGETKQVKSQFSVEEVSNAIVNHLEETTVSITARLASTTATFKELMTLQTGDILLLDKKIDEPIDLIVQDQPIFRGQPVKSSGKYAVAITELGANTT